VRLRLPITVHGISGMLTGKSNLKVYKVKKSLSCEGWRPVKRDEADSGGKTFLNNLFWGGKKRESKARQAKKAPSFEGKVSRNCGKSHHQWG